MLSKDDCRRLLKGNNKTYTDKEIESIIELMYNLASMVVTDLKEQEDEKSSFDGPGVK